MSHPLIDSKRSNITAATTIHQRVSLTFRIRSRIADRVSHYQKPCGTSIALAHSDFGRPPQSWKANQPISRADRCHCSNARGRTCHPQRDRFRRMRDQTSEPVGLNAYGRMERRWYGASRQFLHLGMVLAYAACLDEALAKSGPACRFGQLSSARSSALHRRNAVGLLPARASQASTSDDLHARRVCSCTAPRHQRGIRSPHSYSADRTPFQKPFQSTPSRFIVDHLCKQRLFWTPLLLKHFMVLKLSLILR